MWAPLFFGLGDGNLTEQKFQMSNAREGGGELLGGGWEGVPNSVDQYIDIK